MARFIAEIGSNHNQDLERCLALVEAAGKAGCDAVKLQVYRVDDLFAPEALAAHPELEERRAWEFPLEFLPAVRRRCDECGVELGAAAFGLWAIEPLGAYVDWLKVASYELLWHELVARAAASGLPLILSTGMATLAEVGAAVAVARGAGAEELRLLHCVSGYPTPVEQSNLAAIATLREAFDCPVGWSDHTVDPRIVVRATQRWGAADVELHLDLDGSGYEAGAHCWRPGAVARLVEAVARGARDSLEADEALAIDGDGIKRPMPAEEHDVAWRADPADGLRPLVQVRATLAPA